jgi:hypothetical protein
MNVDVNDVVNRKLSSSQKKGTFGNAKDITLAVQNAHKDATILSIQCGYIK